MINTLPLQSTTDLTNLVSVPWEKVTIVGILLMVIFGLIWHIRDKNKSNKSEIDQKEEEIKNLKRINLVHTESPKISS